MENNLRKHILSNYAFVNGIENIKKTTIDSVIMKTELDGLSTDFKGPPRITESVENSDVDEMIMMGTTQITKSTEVSDSDALCFGEPTALTHAIEDSDPDEFRLEEITIETRGTETSDPDEMQMEPTKHTFTVETSDEDGFLLM